MQLTNMAAMCWGQTQLTPERQQTDAQQQQSPAHTLQLPLPHPTNTHTHHTCLYLSEEINIWFNDIWEITVSKQLIYLKYTIKHMEISTMV